MAFWQKKSVPVHFFRKGFHCLSTLCHWKVIERAEQLMSGLKTIEGIRRGSPEAAEELLRRFGRPLHRYFSVSLSDRSATEDAVQEVFLRLISMIRSGRGSEVRSLEAVVFTIARRLAIDLNRSWNRRPPIDSIHQKLSPGSKPGSDLESGLPSRGPCPRELAAQTEQLEQVEAALRELDSDVREVIMLRHMENLSTREVAEILGIAEGTVWSKLHRGLQLLRKKLASRPARSALSVNENADLKGNEG